MHAHLLCDEFTFKLSKTKYAINSLALLLNNVIKLTASFKK